MSHTSTLFTNITPNELNVFELLKKGMGGKHVRSDEEEVKPAVHKSLQSRPKDALNVVYMYFKSSEILVFKIMKTTSKKFRFSFDIPS